MENDENVSVTITTYFRLLLFSYSLVFIKYFCEPSLEGYSIQNRKKVITKII